MISSFAQKGVILLLEFLSIPPSGSHYTLKEKPRRHCDSFHPQMVDMISSMGYSTLSA